MSLCSISEVPVLVVGVDGLIGKALASSFEMVGRPVWQTTRRKDSEGGKHIFLDLSLNPAHWEIPSVSFESVVLCGAVTSIEQCRIRPNESWKVNVSGMVSLARHLINSGSFVVFISSNMVFDGLKPYAESTDFLAPKTEYGCQKAKAEKELLQLGSRVAVVRFSKIIDPSVKLFKDWCCSLRMGKAIHPFSDVLLSPVPLWFAIDVLRCVVDKKICGIIQVSAPEEISYEALARYLARKLGADSSLVVPIVNNGAKHAFQQPHTTLDISRLQYELNMVPPNIWDAVEVLC